MNSIISNIGLGILGDVIYDESVKYTEESEEKSKVLSKIPWFLGYGGHFSSWYIVTANDLPHPNRMILDQQIEYAKLMVKEIQDLYQLSSMFHQSITSGLVIPSSTQIKLQGLSTREKILISELSKIVQLHGVNWTNYKNQLGLYLSYEYPQSNQIELSTIESILKYTWSERLKSLNNQKISKLSDFQNYHNDVVNCQKTCNCIGGISNHYNVVCIDKSNNQRVTTIDDYRPSISDGRLIIPTSSQGSYQI